MYFALNNAKNMQNKTVNKANIKEVIPYGGIKEIAKRSKTSIYTVSRVVNGGSKNLRVKAAITEYLIEVNETGKKLNQAVATLIS